MKHQQVNHPKGLFRTVKSAVCGGSREPRLSALYLPTVHHTDSYRSSDGSPSDGSGRHTKLLRRRTSVQDYGRRVRDALRVYQPSPEGRVASLGRHVVDRARPFGQTCGAKTLFLGADHEA